MTIFNQKQQAAKKFYNELTFETAKKTSAIVTTNDKLEKTGTGTAKAVGIALYPAFKGSCSNPTTCIQTCIGFVGVANIMKGSNNYKLSNTDKAMLKRLWLFNNEPEYFYARAKNEIETISEFGKYKILFREITSECINYKFFQKLDGVTTYGYFKDSTKIDSFGENIPSLKIYSWNEKSRVGLLDYCINNDVPVAVVVPKKLFKTLLNNPVNNSTQVDFNLAGDVVFHNGDKSDLSSYQNLFTGKLNIHLLSEKVARYSNVMDRPVFLDSYKKLFSFLKLYNVNGYEKIIDKVAAC